MINHLTSPKLYRSYDPHRSRDSMSPVCGIFFFIFTLFMSMFRTFWPFFCARFWKRKIVTAQKNPLLECLLSSKVTAEILALGYIKTHYNNNTLKNLLMSYSLKGNLKFQNLCEKGRVFRNMFYAVLPRWGSFVVDVLSLC